VNIHELSVVTIINAGRTTSYSLNSSRDTERKLTKFLHSVQKSLLINPLQLTLRCSNLFQNASVPNEGRLSNCNQVAATIPQTPFLNSEVAGLTFTKFYTR